MIDTVSFQHNRLHYLDQRFLPLKENYIETNDYHSAVEAIKTLAVRGAPLIGIVGGYALVMAAAVYKGKKKEFKKYFTQAVAEVEASRPTAVNLFFATKRIKRVVQRRFESLELPKLVEALSAEARAIHSEEVLSCDRISEHGTRLLEKTFAKTLKKRSLKVLTHCNTGSLATGGSGTALGVIKAAFAAGLIEKVYASETRPLLQGLRLTAWELEKEKIPFQVIADGASGMLMQRGEIDFVIAGADRIARNGDTANKIGTFNHAAVAQAHKLPFYIAAPISTMDAAIESGKEIVIEERSGEELRVMFGRRIAPEKMPALNLAFDVTPAKFITAIITEAGVFKKPYKFET